MEQMANMQAAASDGVDTSKHSHQATLVRWPVGSDAEEMPGLCYSAHTTQNIKVLRVNEDASPAREAPASITALQQA